MAVRFIADFPALFITDKKILVISDLHVGLEHELFRVGVVIPPQAEKFQKDIDHLARITKAKNLVILGDIKHKVPGISYREEKEIPKLFSNLIEKFQVICVRGNHDDNISTLLPKEVKIYPSRGFRIGKYGFFHGHTWPSKKLMQCDHLFMGHTHSMIQFKDKFGYRIIEPVWMRSRIYRDKIKEKYKVKRTGELEVIIVPAFNRLLGGTSINVKTASDELLGPLLKNNFIDIDNAELYLLDGAYLGKVSALKLFLD
ncbi:MAG: metallophosphoesterase [Candidatus Aenigmarchaeota archaeon]|nr:metallophosphoesterase [Candidatus Aenigmarchaeota archaeon]